MVERRPIFETLEYRKVLNATVNVQPFSVIAGDVGEIRVSLSAPVANTVTVDCSAANNTANLGPDYVMPPSVTVVFQPGQTLAKPVPVVTFADPDEPDGITSKAFRITLSDPTGGVSLGTSQALGTIIEPANTQITTSGMQGQRADDDSDSSLNVSISDAGNTVEGDFANFQVTLSQIYGSDVSVYYETTDGTALAGANYVASAGYVTIPAGTSTADITVATIDQGDNEPYDAYFCVELTGTNSENISAAGTASAFLQYSGTSVNNSVSINDAGNVVAGQDADFNLTLAQPRILPDRRRNRLGRFRLQRDIRYCDDFGRQFDCRNYGAYHRRGGE
jgi:hypothetical protein